jgi:hypothetical protein
VAFKSTSPSANLKIENANRRHVSNQPLEDVNDDNYLCESYIIDDCVEEQDNGIGLCEEKVTVESKTSTQKVEHLNGTVLFYICLQCLQIRGTHS